MKHASTAAGIALLVLVHGLAGCGDSRDSLPPLAPSPVLQLPPRPVQVAVFTDPVSGFATSDVRDVDEQIVHFNTAGELVWTADDTRFPGFRWSGESIRGPGPDDYFQVRFGKKNGEQRVYLGWSDDFCHCPGYPATVVDIEVVGGQLIIKSTDVGVPGS